MGRLAKILRKLSVTFFWASAFFFIAAAILNIATGEFTQALGEAGMALVNIFVFVPYVEKRLPQ